MKLIKVVSVLSPSFCRLLMSSGMILSIPAALPFFKLAIDFDLF